MDNCRQDNKEFCVVNIIDPEKNNFFCISLLYCLLILVLLVFNKYNLYVNIFCMLILKGMAI